MGVALLAGSALAADNGATEHQKGDPATSVHDWSGFYSGINGGFSDTANKDLQSLDAGSVATEDRSGADNDGQAGPNSQSRHIGIAIEGEVDKAFVIRKSK